MISVITPVYNGQRFIESCINVVLDQGCPDVEHIIVDGGSVDGTVEVIRQYAETCSHIRWVSEKDRGQSDAMNKGIQMARGEILGVLNVDDSYEPNVLNRVMELFRTLPEPGLLVGNCNVWDSEGDLLYVNKPRRLKLTDLLLGPDVNPYPFNPSAYFYHSSLHHRIGLYKVDEHYAMDLDFLLRAVQVAMVRYVDETWGNFRMTEGTKTLNDKRSGEITCRVENILKYYQKDLPPVQQWQVAIRHRLHRSRSWRAVNGLLRKLRKSPSVLKARLTKSWDLLP
jgi:glycosyltransferase involved in cell wall biosynthesis